MAFGERLAWILATGVTLGASLSQKKELIEMKERWGFKDLFEFAAEEVKMTFMGSSHGKTSNANALRVSPAEYYVDTYEGGVSFAEWDLCDVDVASNLGGKGPGGGPPELRYSKVMTAVGVGPVDLTVKATNSYLSNNVSANGVRECFGIINVLADDVSVDFEFGFVATGTNIPVVFSNMYFTIYDMDTGPDNTAAEKVTVYDDATKIFKEKDCDYTTKGTLEKGLTMTASHEGTGDDNPDFPYKLTEAQRKKSITVQYKNVSTWKATFDVTNGDGGRNFMFAGESPPTKEKNGVCRIEGDCVIWGDPHILTFDATSKLAAQYPNRREFLRIRNRKTAEVNVFDEGNFWLVKSNDVHIQGRYNLRKEHAERTVLGGLAVGGPFLKNNTFIIRPLTGKITWNGHEVLKHLGSAFTNRLIHAKYHKDAESVSDGRKGDGIDVKLPGNVKLTVNRFERGLAVKISMCAREWQDGQCGNFNGNANDDKQDFLMSRVQPLRREEKLPWREHVHLAPSRKKQAKAHDQFALERN